MNKKKNGKRKKIAGEKEGEKTFVEEGREKRNYYRWSSDHGGHSNGTRGPLAVASGHG